MEFPATQIFEDDDFSPTQKIPNTIEKEEPVLVSKHIFKCIFSLAAFQ